MNTNRPNQIAKEAIQKGLIPALNGFDHLRSEVKYGTNSRIDILLETRGRRPIFVEVKNVHFVRNPGLHEFPDSVTARGAKHLDEMAAEVEKGNRAAMVYVIQRNDGDKFQLAADLDPVYADAFERAKSKGVEAYALRCDVGTERIEARDLIEIAHF